MTKRGDGPVVGLGLVNKDFVASVPSWERDGKVAASAYFEQVGGPVPVALAALARLEGGPGNVSLLGVLGDDRDGDDLLGWLAAGGVDGSLVTRAPATSTSRSLVLLDERDGTRTVANWAGGLPPLTPFTPEQEALLARAGLLHLDGRDLDASLRAAEIVRGVSVACGAGGVVSLDLGTMRPGGERLLPLCDIVIASRKGGSGAFPDAVRGGPQAADSPAEQVRRFLDLGAEIAGVTLGHEGVVIGERGGGEPVHLPAFVVERVVDTCGAGDAFHGAFLAAHRAGRGPIEAAGFAQAAVAVRIARRGNQAGLPTRAEVEAFMETTGGGPPGRKPRAR